MSVTLAGILKESDMRNRIENIFVLMAKMLGSAWLALFISLFPMYIQRGVLKYDERLELRENVLLAVCGIVFGFAVLSFIVSRGDRVARAPKREVILEAGLASGIYAFVCVIWWVFNPNNTAVCVNGLRFALLFGRDEDGFPLFFGTLISAVVYCGAYFCAVMLGAFLARKRRKKEMDKLK